MSDERITVEDAYGTVLTVGLRVRGEDPPDGVIVAVTDPETDVDEDGRPQAVNPRVYVHWDGEAQPEADSEGWQTSYDGEHAGGEHVYVIEDLTGYRSTEG